jgi:type IV pilus assembly protein PilM
MVLDIGASATKAYVVERGVVALSHNIRQGGQDVTRTIASAHNLEVSHAETMKKEHGFGNSGAPYDKATIELVFSRIFDEARRVLGKYETANQRPVSRLILTGGGGVTKELGTYAKEFFAIDVEVADPFAKTSAPAFMRPVLKEIGPEFAVAVGLALRKLEELG